MASRTAGLWFVGAVFVDDWNFQFNWLSWALFYWLIYGRGLFNQVHPHLIISWRQADVLNVKKPIAHEPRVAELSRSFTAYILTIRFANLPIVITRLCTTS